MMRKAIIIIGLMTAIIYGTSWKNGNTANYDADTVCASAYLLHTTGRSCDDTVISGDWGTVPVVVDGETIWIDIPLPAPETIYIASETLYIGRDTLIIFDTVAVVETSVVINTESNLSFTTHPLFICDSVLISIDTTVSPNDSVWCKFCDSVLVVSWWIADGTDTITVANWQMLYGASDSCGIIWQHYPDITLNPVYITYQYCYDCDTTIYITYINPGDDDNGDFGVWVDVDSQVIFVPFGDTIRFPSRSTGVWWRYCDGSAIDTLAPSDSVDLTFAIDTSWEVYWGGTRYEYGDAPIDTVIAAIRQLPAGVDISLYSQPRHPILTRYVGGDATAHEIEDSIKYYFGADDTIWANGQFWRAYQALYCGFDTTGWAGVWTRTCYEGVYQSCTGLDYECCRNQTNIPCAFLMKFIGTLNYNIYGAEYVDLLNNLQPDWIIITQADDNVPYIVIDGEFIYLDTVQTTNWHYKEFRVPIAHEINYSTPIKIELGVWSPIAPYIGAQVLFGVVLDTTEQIYSSDTLIIPPCCPDTLCFEQYVRIPVDDTASYDNYICYNGIEGEKICYALVDSCYSTCIDTVFTYKPSHSLQLNSIALIDTISNDTTFLKAGEIGGNTTIRTVAVNVDSLAIRSNPVAPNWIVDIGYYDFGLLVERHYYYGDPPIYMKDTVIVPYYSANKVGIMTNSPSYTLDVNGTARISDSLHLGNVPDDATGDSVLTLDGGVVKKIATSSIGGSSADADWSGAGTGDMYTTNLTDDVGIGIATPSAKLEVYGNAYPLVKLSSDNDVWLQLSTAKTHGNASLAIEFMFSDWYSADIIYDGLLMSFIADSFDFSGQLRVSYNNVVANSEVVPNAGIRPNYDSGWLTVASNPDIFSLYHNFGSIPRQYQIILGYDNGSSTITTAVNAGWFDSGGWHGIKWDEFYTDADSVHIVVYNNVGGGTYSSVNRVRVLLWK